MNQKIVKGQLSEALHQLASPIFICGGAYSGKSELAHQCLDPDQPAAVIGTSGNLPDSWMQARIAELQAARSKTWRTFEGVDDLSRFTADLCARYPQLLLDSINQYLATALTNRLDQYDRVQIEEQLALEIDQFLGICRQHPTCRVVVVSAETGSGVPPQRTPARAFRKVLSLINCRIASAAQTVIDVRYGIPVQIK